MRISEMEHQGRGLDRGMTTHRPTPLGRLAIALLIIVIGVPAFFILLVGTWGTFLVPLVVAAIASPFFALHYVVWGYALSRSLQENPGDKQSEN